MVGRFVWTLDEFGLGRVVGLQDGLCTVRFFKSVDEFVQREYDVDQVKTAYLRPQTRAYICDEDGSWSVGRVVDYLLEQDELSYVVQFPNRKDRKIPEADLQVRCFLPVEDPAAVLAAGGIETQYLHDRRRTALECLSHARAASYGLTGLLSASVELLSHQVEVVRRVLNDPVQRYLLADEVGLGKTIEACAIVKQAIFDNPGERVIVLAPASLTGQWTRELSWRFFIQSPQHQLSVLPFDQLHTVDPSEVDTLVIDEAHNLIPAEPAWDADYMAIERLSSRAQRLLLISATPVLGNERTLLALLHLLDPQTYRFDEEDAFLEKVQHSQEFGRVLLALNPEQPTAFLRRTLQLLRRLVHSDEIAGELITGVERGIESEQDKAVSESVSALQRHIGDTYRLHQRLIRTRRRDLPEYVIAPRTAVLDILLEDDDERTPDLVDALDRWRHRSLEALVIMPIDERGPFELGMVSRYSRLHEALGTSVEECDKELRKQLDSVRTGQDMSFNDDEEALVYALLKASEDTEDTRVEMAKSVIERALRRLEEIVQRPRLVVFGTSTEFVLMVADQLDAHRIADVFRVVESSDNVAVLDAVDGFFRSSEAAVLVCDRRGEEGLNLQFAHGIVHLDLPLEPARVEQRIGRLDRLGREFTQIQEIYHWVIAPYFEKFHPWQAWFEMLRDDFKVFDRSISEVQFLLEDLQSAVRLALYQRGAVGISELAPQVRDAITQERQRLDEQYALDSRTVNSGDTEDAFQSIELLDTAQHYEPIDKWLTEVLLFRRDTIDDIPTAFNYHWTHRTLLPQEPEHAFILKESLAQSMTYERGQAAYRRGLRLVRPGLELVDQLENLLRWDDRGTAFATWRSDPRWTGEGRGTWLGFRLIYILEANVKAVHYALRESINEIIAPSLRRRMDSLLPPWTTTIDVDLEMNSVMDPLLREILDRPYSDRNDEHGRRDYNLGSRRDALYESIGFHELANACRRAKEASEGLLRSSPQFQEWTEVNARRAISEINSDNERLKRRQDAKIRETGKADAGMKRDIRVNEAIAAALTSPSVRLDAIGLFVVSNCRPREGEEERDHT